MEKSNQPSFLKSLALAFGDGLAFGVAVKLAQGPSKTREVGMTDLGPLAERLRKVEDRKEQAQTIDKDALMKFGEGLDGRVLEKVIVAMEARLTEHAGHVDRRLAEIDAQVALDLKAVDTHTSAQTNAVEKAIQDIERQVHDYVSAAQQSSAEQIAGVDQKLSALQEALPAKFREIIEAVRQSMEARLALELKEVEDRVAAGRVAPEHLQELEGKLRSEMEALSGRLSSDLHGLAEHQQNQTAPLQQALQQLETKLTTLREELPPKIRQIVEAVEASMAARISAGDRETTGRMASLEQSLAALRSDLPTAGGFQQAIDENLRRHAEQVGALDQKLTVLQEELPPKIKAIVDAVRDSLDARMAVELQAIEDKHSTQIQQTEARFGEAQQQLRQQLAAESKTPSLEQDLAQLRTDLRGQAATVTAELEQLESRLRTSLASEIQDLETRTPDRSADLEKAMQYAALLEARVQALEDKLHQSAEETVDRAVERVWQALEVRLQQRAAQAPPAAQSAETVTGLRQRSTSAEQSVLDLIAGIGQLFEKPGPRLVPDTPRETPPPPPAPAAHVEPEPVAAAPVAAEPVAVVHAEPEDDEPEPPAPAAIVAAPEPVAAAHVQTEPAPVEVEPEPPAPAAPAAIEPAPVPPAQPEHAEPAATPAAAPVAAAVATAEMPETSHEEKPPLILFKPKESGRKWRIPFVSSFLLMAVALAWLEFM
jgi:hypothetical protein